MVEGRSGKELEAGIGLGLGRRCRRRGMCGWVLGDECLAPASAMGEGVEVKHRGWP